VIRRARRADLPTLGPIEAAAQQRFRGTDLAAMADSDTLPMAVLEQALAHALLWVSTDARDASTGFLAARVIDDSLFIIEVSVHPACQGQRLGAALIAEAAGKAKELNLPWLSLITDRYIAWNAPYYARLGFVVQDNATLGAGLAAALDDDHNHVIDPARRVVMVRASSQPLPASLPT
jgi:GNAT superfamily N-acetyltransferase